MLHKQNSLFVSCWYPAQPYLLGVFVKLSGLGVFSCLSYLSIICSQLLFLKIEWYVINIQHTVQLLKRLGVSRLNKISVSQCSLAIPLHLLTSNCYRNYMIEKGTFYLWVEVYLIPYSSFCINVHCLNNRIGGRWWKILIR